MINLNLSQDNKLTFNVGIVGTKTPPNIVRLCIGNDLVRLSFDASPTKSEIPNNSEWTVTIPALPELSKYFVGVVRIKIEVIVAGRFFIPFDKELSIEASGNSSFEVTNMTIANTQVSQTIPAEEEEEEVKEPEEKKEIVATNIMRIIEPKVEENKKQPVLSKEMLLGDHVSTIKEEKTPAKQTKNTKKYYLKPLKQKQPKETKVSISNVVKSVIKEESKKDAAASAKVVEKEPVIRNTPKKNEIPFQLIKKNIVEK